LSVTLRICSSSVSAMTGVAVASTTMTPASPTITPELGSPSAV
jgi:hypothetical protein